MPIKFILRPQYMAAALLPLLIVGCNEGSDASAPNSNQEAHPAPQYHEPIALDGFGVVVPNQKTYIDLSSYLKGTDIKIDSYIEELSGNQACGQATQEGLGMNVHVSNDGALCQYKYSAYASDNSLNSSAEVMVLATNSSDPVLPPKSETATVKDNQKDITLPFASSNKTIETVSLQSGLPIEQQGKVEKGEGNVVKYTPAKIPGWERIIYVTKDKKSGASQLGYVYVTISDTENRNPVIAESVHTYQGNQQSQIKNNNRKITIDLGNEKTTNKASLITDDGDWQLVSANMIYTGSQFSVNPISIDNKDDVTNKTFQINTDVMTELAGREFAVQYIVTDNYGGYSQGIINFTLNVNEKTQDWGDINKSKTLRNSFSAPQRYSDALKSGFYANPWWDKTKSNTVASYDQSAAKVYCGAVGILPSLSEMQELGIDSTSKTELAKWPSDNSYWVRLPDGSLGSYDIKTKKQATYQNGKQHYLSCIRSEQFKVSMLNQTITVAETYTPLLSYSSNFTGYFELVGQPSSIHSRGPSIHRLNFTAGKTEGCTKSTVSNHSTSSNNPDPQMCFKMEEDKATHTTTISAKSTKAQNFQFLIKTTNNPNEVGSGSFLTPLVFFVPDSDSLTFDRKDIRIDAMPTSDDPKDYNEMEFTVHDKFGNLFKDKKITTELIQDANVTTSKAQWKIKPPTETDGKGKILLFVKGDMPTGESLMSPKVNITVEQYNRKTSQTTDFVRCNNLKSSTWLYVAVSADDNNLDCGNYDIWADPFNEWLGYSKEIREKNNQGKIKFDVSLGDEFESLDGVAHCSWLRDASPYVSWGFIKSPATTWEVQRNPSFASALYKPSDIQTRCNDDVSSKKMISYAMMTPDVSAKWCDTFNPSDSDKESYINKTALPRTKDSLNITSVSKEWNPTKWHSLDASDLFSVSQNNHFITRPLTSFVFSARDRVDINKTKESYVILKKLFPSAGHGVSHPGYKKDSAGEYREITIEEGRDFASILDFSRGTMNLDKVALAYRSDKYQDVDLNNESATGSSLNYSLRKRKFDDISPTNPAVCTLSRQTITDNNGVVDRTVGDDSLHPDDYYGDGTDQWLCGAMDNGCYNYPRGNRYPTKLPELMIKVFNKIVNKTEGNLFFTEAETQGMVVLLVKLNLDDKIDASTLAKYLDIEKNKEPELYRFVTDTTGKHMEAPSNFVSYDWSKYDEYRKKGCTFTQKGDLNKDKGTNNFTKGICPATCYIGRSVVYSKWENYNANTYNKISRELHKTCWPNSTDTPYKTISLYDKNNP